MNRAALLPLGGGMVCALMSALAFAQGQDREWRTPEAKAWSEADVALPALPAARDLVEVDVAGGSPTRFYVDTGTVTLEEDKVLRLTLVAVTAGGARTVTREGFRCKTGEYRLYGIGAGNAWSTPQRSEWRQVARTGYSHVRVVLLDTVLCEIGVANLPERVVRNLRYPPAPGR